MELDELIRTEVQRLRLPFHPAAEAAAIRAEVRRRRARRRAAAVPVGIAAAVAVGAVAVGVAGVGLRSGDGDDGSVHLSTETTTTAVPTSTTAPDPLAGAGVCRSLLPEDLDTTATAPAVTTTVAPTIPVPPEVVDPVEPEVDTPCGLALAAEVADRIAPSWRPWDDNPFGNAAVEEWAPPDSFGTATASFTDDSGAILQVTAGYGPREGDLARLQGFGRPLDDLPDGWAGTTDFVPGEDRISADVTVVRPGRYPVMVAVKLGNPGMGPPQPERSVLPMTYDQVRALAIALADDGPVQSP